MEQITLDKIYNILITGDYSLVICSKRGGLHTFRGRGVIDLFNLYNDLPDVLDGALVADKAVGLGAAVLMSLGNISKLKTPVISRDAYELLRRSNITVEAEIIADFLKNRSGTGRCPLEERLRSLNNPDLIDMLTEIKLFLQDKGILK